MNKIKELMLFDLKFALCNLKVMLLDIHLPDENLLSSYRARFQRESFFIF